MDSTNISLPLLRISMAIENYGTLIGRTQKVLGLAGISSLTKCVSQIRIIMYENKKL
jgi:hypothetical protein